MKNFLKLSSLLIYTGEFMQYVTIDYEKYKYLFGSHKTRYFLIKNEPYDTREYLMFNSKSGKFYILDKNNFKELERGTVESLFMFPQSTIEEIPDFNIDNIRMLCELKK